jgi:transposase
MHRKSALLNKSVISFAQAELKKLGEYAYVSKKLQAVIAASKHGITDVAKIYDISRTTLTEWIRRLGQENIDKLKAPEERKRRSRLDIKQREVIREWIATNPNITIKELRIMIKDRLSIGVSKSTVHRTMKLLSFSYQTPRPKHYKQDQTIVEEFKKKSTNPPTTNSKQ